MAAVTAGPVPADGALGLGGLRLTVRGRVVLAVLAVLLVVPAALGGASAVADAPGQPLEVRLHTVAPGETLWRYAEQLAAPGQDVRDVVVELRDLNGLQTSHLQVGQVVVLPMQ